MRRLLLFSAAVLAFVVTPGLAAPTTDNFNFGLLGDNTFAGGRGSGYNDGTGEVDISGYATPWYYYENTGWYNQWFYDDPPDPTRWKEITYEIGILESPSLPASHVVIALNWSTLAYPESGPDRTPPLPGLFDPPTEWLEDVFIVREVIFDGMVDDFMYITGTVIIPDYNPEWVSIDIYAEIEGSASELLVVDGTITHECLPAPGAILLGSIGVGLVGWLRRRRKL